MVKRIISYFAAWLLTLGICVGSILLPNRILQREDAKLLNQNHNEKMEKVETGLDFQNVLTTGEKLSMLVSWNAEAMYAAEQSIDVTGVEIENKELMLENYPDFFKKSYRELKKFIDAGFVMELSEPEWEQSFYSVFLQTYSEKENKKIRFSIWQIRFTDAMGSQCMLTMDTETWKIYQIYCFADSMSEMNEKERAEYCERFTAFFYDYIGASSMSTDSMPISDDSTIYSVRTIYEMGNKDQWIFYNLRLENLQVYDSLADKQVIKKSTSKVFFSWQIYPAY
ncbi:hypothetical protein [Anaerolentibacter hominis]|uniref:hypothetical protein n=1 Tax=Anaerolentibacter hominis TaxID=3079009 RepID=UPI0031B841AA